MDSLIGIASVALVCALVGLLLFVLMHLMAASHQPMPRADMSLEERIREESR